MVLLIYPSMNFANKDRDVDYKNNLNPEDKVIPFGILSIASSIKYNNFDVKILDGRYFAKEVILSEINKIITKVDIIGFSVMTIQIPHALFLSKYIKKRYKNKIIIWGGIHPTLFPSDTIKDNNIDFICYGEGEKSIIKLIKYIRYKKGSLKNIDGIAYKHNKKIIINAPEKLIDLDSIPQLNYDLLNIEFYLKRKLINGKIVNGIDILTSRGCPYRCTFCVNTFLNYKKWRAYDDDKVIKQIVNLTKKYNLGNIWFADDYFFGSKSRAIKILQGIIDNHLNIMWEANIRANNFQKGFVDSETLNIMTKSGCYALYMGFESGSDRMLRFYKKDITVDQIKYSVKQISKYNIYVKGFWMMGAPTETKKEIFKTFSLIYELSRLSLKFIPAAPGIYRPYPGGELYKFVINKYKFYIPKTLKKWTELISKSGYLDPRTFPWIKNLSLLQELRFYGRLIAGGYKGIFNSPKLYFVKIIIFLINLRFKYKLWSFRFEAKLFYFFNNLIKNKPKIKDYFKIPFNI